MTRLTTTLAAAAALTVVHPVSGQTTTRPFSSGIRADDGVLVVGVTDFATIPESDGQAPRMMLLVDEPGTRRMFVNDMRGPLYWVSYDGSTVTGYVDIDDGRWGVSVQSSGRERGFQSFAFHPDFGREGAPGYGRFYTWTDTDNDAAEPDFEPDGGGNAHHTVLLEWRARDASADTYDGGRPRELMRFRQPFANHNGGHAVFDPFAAPGDPDYGLLYLGVADGGSGGDPMNMAQDLGSAFGKILRIDPLGADAANGMYGIPSANPYVADDDPTTLGEIFASGVRNPQRIGWDPATGAMYMADIGQNLVEEVSPVTAGANLGWNRWEGSFAYVGRAGVDVSNPRGDPAMTYPVAEYAHGDPLLGSRAAATGVVVYRGDAIPQLENRVLFGDFPSGEIFHFDADHPPQGGNQGFGRVLLDDGRGRPVTFLEVIRAKNRGADRADLRFGRGPDGRVLLLNKHDGVVRLLVPDRRPAPAPPAVSP